MNVMTARMTELITNMLAERPNAELKHLSEEAGGRFSQSMIPSSKGLPSGSFAPSQAFVRSSQISLHGTIALPSASQ